MQKRYKIRWRESDSKKLSNAVRQFNAKRTRLIKQVPELEDFLPNKLNVQEIRRNTKTRSDFNKTINSINRFLRKGAEKPIVTPGGVRTTAYELREVQIKARTVNQRRAIQRKKANVSTEKGTMGTIQANNLLPKRTDVQNITAHDWAKYVESVEKQSRESYEWDKQQRYKENFIQGLRNAFGPAADELIVIAMNIPADVLTQMYYDDPVLQIDFFYDPIEMMLKIESMMEHLQAYLSGLGG